MAVHRLSRKSLVIVLVDEVESFAGSRMKASEANEFVSPEKLDGQATAPVVWVETVVGLTTQSSPQCKQKRSNWKVFAGEGHSHLGGTAR